MYNIRSIGSLAQTQIHNNNNYNSYISVNKFRKNLLYFITKLVVRYINNY
jgi:hypothetical protein